MEAVSNDNNKGVKKAAYCPTSNDLIKNIVLREGRAARNLIAWNVPVSNSNSTDDDTEHENASSPIATKIVRRSRSLTSTTRQPRRRNSSTTNFNENSNNSTNFRRVANDLRARYWAFLFENLRRAVDEIYNTCENDESVVECSEVIMILEQCTQDFKSLINRIQIIKDYEMSGNKNIPLAWDVRKISVSPTKLVNSTLIPITATDNNSVEAITTMSNTEVIINDEISTTDKSSDEINNITSYSEALKKNCSSKKKLIFNRQNSSEKSNIKSIYGSTDTLIVSNVDNDKLLDFDKLTEGGTKTWNDLVDEDHQARTPGRIVKVHEKLSSPSRKIYSTSDVQLKHEMKLQKAIQNRAKFHNSITDKAREKWKQVEEVRASKEKKLVMKRENLQQKLHRVEQNRNRLKVEIVKKCQDEEIKAKEIAFINTVQQEIMRDDIRYKDEKIAKLLEGKQNEFVRRKEEKAANEAAVEARRKKLLADRQAKLIDKQKKRKQLEAEREINKNKEELERIELAKKREQDRNERLANIELQQQEKIQSIQQRMQQKQMDSERRYTEHLQQIKDKAFEMSIVKHSTTSNNNDEQPPNPIPYDTKKSCSLCNILISCEVQLQSHLGGKQHMQAVKEKLGGEQFLQNDLQNVNLQHILDIPLSNNPDPLIKQREKNLKKKLRKLRQRMVLSTDDSEATANLNGKSKKLVMDLSRSSPPSERTLNDLIRCINQLKQSSNRKDDAILVMVKAICQNVLVRKEKENIKLLRLASTAIINYMDIVGQFFIKSNLIIIVIDLLSKELQESAETLEFSLCGNLLKILSESLKHSTSSNLLSYIICSGVFDKLSIFFGECHLIGSINKDTASTICWFFNQALIFIDIFCKNCKVQEASSSSSSVFIIEEFLSCLKATDLLQVITLMYGILLYSLDNNLELLTEENILFCLDIFQNGFNFLNSLAVVLNLKEFQSLVTNNEGNSLELRHIAGFLLKRKDKEFEKLIDTVIIHIGFFMSRNVEAQVAFLTGQQPTVLQSLVNLNVDYFCNKVDILIPSLIAASYLNLDCLKIVCENLSKEILIDFIRSKINEEENVTNNCQADKNDNQSDLMEYNKEIRLFKYRLPRNEWEAAIEFYEKNCN